MKQIKSERLKKLESEFHDLEEWLKLGLVPKKDLEKHKDEMNQLQSKIDEEKERLQFLKEGGEAEEFIVPKRNAGKAGYNDMPTIPDIDMVDGSGLSESSFEVDTYSYDDTTFDEENDSKESFTTNEYDDEDLNKDDDEDDESYFSDRNRWRRGGIVDPDADDW